MFISRPKFHKLPILERSVSRSNPEVHAVMFIHCVYELTKQELCNLDSTQSSKHRYKAETLSAGDWSIIYVTCELELTINKDLFYSFHR
jgi:hypothetical protein